MIYLELLWGFLQVGCLAFGGAYAAIPFIRDIVLQYGWLNDDSLSYIIAISESTPGPIMVNMATYVGQSQGGLAGAIIATLAVITPAFLITILIMVILSSWLSNRWIRACLRGLLPCISGIILATGICMAGRCLWDNTHNTWDGRALLIACLLVGISLLVPRLSGRKISAIGLIVIAALLGIALS